MHPKRGKSHVSYPGTNRTDKVRLCALGESRCRRGAVSSDAVTDLFDPWVPLGRRLAGLGPDTTAYDGIPSYLRDALDNWVHDCYPDDTYLMSQLGGSLKFRLRLDEVPNPTDLTEDQLLDLIDALLAWDLRPHHWQFARLEELLTVGGAGWRINASGDGLERRVETTVTAALTQTVLSAGNEAADHLKFAWAAAYGRNPDPDKAYDESVLAVEAVACPLVAPTNMRATLGSIIGDLRNQAARWELAIGDTTGQPAPPDRLIEMLQLLWQGQSRHAGAPNSRRQDQTEAEAAVHLAATLVQWLNSNVLRRKA